METKAALFTSVRGGALTDDRQHFVLVFSNPDGSTVQVAMPMASLDGLKQVVDDLKLLQAGTPEGELTQ
jgi:broad specificity phosphatase PhoE